jgi:phage gpG-like protein
MADIEIEGLAELNNRIREIAGDVKKAKRPLTTASVYMLGSIEKNFQQQGRPKKWTPLNPKTLELRRKSRKANKAAGIKTGRGSRILIDMARLKNSMTFLATDTSAEVGTNVVYARRHQFGYPGVEKKEGDDKEKKGPGRGRGKTPARPFILIQGEDIREIGEIFKRHFKR